MVSGETKDERSLKFQWNAGWSEEKYTGNIQVNTSRLNPAIYIIAYKKAPNPTFPL